MLDHFTTARLTAERLHLSHRSEIQRMHDDPVVMALLGGVRTPEETLAYLERNLAHWERFGHGLWIVRDRESGEVVGRAVLRHLDLGGVDEVEIGYAFYQSHWGRGLATEVAEACLRLGREELGLLSMVALTTPTNHGSQHVLTKVGMVLDRELEHGGAPHLLFRTRDP